MSEDRFSQYGDRPVDMAAIEGMFKEVKYYVTGTIDEKTQKALEVGGAKKTAYLSGINTHCIVGFEPDMNEVSEATDMLDVPSVDQDWVVASALCGHLLPLTPFTPAEGRLLLGAVVCVGDIGEGDRAKVWAMVTWHGGKVVKDLTGEVTHLIVTLPVGELYNNALSRGDISIVNPDWVVDTVRAKAKCDTSLYHPRLLMIPENRQQPVPVPPKLPDPPSLVAQPAAMRGPGQGQQIVTDQLKLAVPQNMRQPQPTTSIYAATTALTATTVTATEIVATTKAVIYCHQSFISIKCQLRTRKQW